MTAAKTRQGERDGGGFVWWVATAIQGDEEEVDGEGHPEGDEDVGDVEAGVEVGPNAGSEGEGGNRGRHGRPERDSGRS